jgi:hypothetical protein
MPEKYVAFRLFFRCGALDINPSIEVQSLNRTGSHRIGNRLGAKNHASPGCTRSIPQEIDGPNSLPPG